MAEALIQIVDEDDRPIGVASKEDAWKKGLIHRIVHVIIKDENGRILLQKRGVNMRLWPNRWTDSASGHVDEGENWEEAARRETAEEIGFQPNELKELVTIFQDTTFEGRILKRFNRYYVTTATSDTNFIAQDSELAEVKWFSSNEVLHMMEDNPENFTPNFVKVFKQLLK